MLCQIHIVIVLGLALLAGAVNANAQDQPISGVLRGVIVRAGDAVPLAAKLFIEGADGRLHTLPDEPSYQTQEWYAKDPPRFSYAERKFQVPLAPGHYRVTATKGFGYRDWEGAVTIRAGQTLECRIAMEAIHPLEEQKWFSGDLHTHTGNITVTMLRVEDVNLAGATVYSIRHGTR